jgi:hypothetical protein
VQQVVTRFVPLLMAQFSIGYDMVGVIFASVSVLIGVIAIVSVIFGWIAVRRRGPDAVTGGIGLGISGAALISVVFALLSAPLLSLILG